MGWSERLAPRGITTQLAALVAISVLIGIAIVAAIALFLFNPPPRSDSPIFTVSRVADITRLVRAARTPAETDTLLAVIRHAGIKVERVALSDLEPAEDHHNLSFTAHFALRQLASRPGIDLLQGMRYPAGPAKQIVTKLDDDRALVFDAMPKTSWWPILLTPTALLLMIVLVSVLLLSIYAVHWIIVPLAEVATAAASFGRSPQDNDVLSRRGPREIMQVTDALNDMRTRIRALLDDRMRMLAAISHDLRTPLTRLRLRVERVSQDELKTAMLADLTKVGRMLDETLEYLRDDARSETASRIDLPSFLQTICTDFADMGHAVSYTGPARLSYACQARALTRAVTNIVENAVKHGSKVTVALGGTPNKIEIEVADDGPGIPAALRDRVFEPFFKADDARSQNNGGFGLGLSIAQHIIKRHGGDIELVPGELTGLRVRLELPPKHLPA